MASLEFLRSSSLVLTTATLVVSFSSLTLAQTPATDAPRSDCPSQVQPGSPAGDRPVTRGDFATGFDNCLNRVEDLSRRSRSGAATQTDLESLIQRQREINLELRSINDRLGNLADPQK